MTRLTLIILALFCTSTLFSANDGFFIKPEANWIVPVSFELDDHLISKNKSNGASYLLLDFQENVEQAELFQHHAIIINEETGIQNYSDLWIDYDLSYQEIYFHKLVIHRGDRQLDRLKIDDFKVTRNETDLSQSIYNGGYTAGIFLEDIQVGDVIEYAYTIKGRNPVFDGQYFSTFYMEFGVPVNKLSLQITFSRDRAIDYKLFGSVEKPEKRISKGLVTLAWELSDLSEVIANTELPSWYIPFARVQLSEFSRWAEVIDWGEKLFPPVDIKGSSLEQKFIDLTKGMERENEKINALIRFVQDEIRYVGIEVNVNSHKPQPPVDVFSKRFGDCKDKSYLLVTLLRQMGVKAWPAFVNSVIKHGVKEYLPSPTVFNHAIVGIQQGEELYFVDPTFSNQKGDFTQTYNGNYQSALLLDDNWQEPVDMRVRSSEKIIIHELIEASDTLLPARFIVESTYMGSEADQIRTAFRSQTPKEQETTYLNFYSYVYPRMRMVNAIEVNDNQAENVIFTKEQFEIDEFWTYNSSSSVKDYTSIITPINLRHFISEPSQTNRQMPFTVYHPIEIENRIEFNHPNETVVEEVEGEINNASFNFSYKVTQAGKKTIFDYKYKSLKDHVTVAEFNNYHRDVEKLISTTWYEYTYGQNGKGNGDSSTNLLMVVISVFFVLFVGYAFSNLYRRDADINSLSVEPLKIGGWLIFPTIGLILAPFLSIYYIIEADYFNQTSWDFISSTSSLGYNQIWTVAFLIELLGNLFFLVYVFFLLLLLFKRRTIFPVHYIVLRILNLLFVIFHLFLTGMIDSEYFEASNSVARALIGPVVAVGVWVPYMLVSQRVKDTFVLKFNEAKHRIYNTEGNS
jgi:hypothetical protein